VRSPFHFLTLGAGLARGGGSIPYEGDGSAEPPRRMKRVLRLAVLPKAPDARFGDHSSLHRHTADVRQQSLCSPHSGGCVAGAPPRDCDLTPAPPCSSRMPR
jgi:hypothetical protein